MTAVVCSDNCIPATPSSSQFSPAPVWVLSMGYSLSGTDCSSKGSPWATVPARKPAPAWTPLHLLQLTSGISTCSTVGSSTGCRVATCSNVGLHHWMVGNLSHTPCHHLKHHLGPCKASPVATRHPRRNRVRQQDSERSRGQDLQTLGYSFRKSHLVS